MILTHFDIEFVKENYKELYNYKKNESIMRHEILMYLSKRFPQICIRCNRSVKEYVTNLLNHYDAYETNNKENNKKI